MQERARMAVAGDPRGYYRTLGVDRTASAEDIKAAFRQRAKDLHPDQSGGQGDEAAFRVLREAYEALRDPQLRLRYDAESLEAERTGHADDRSSQPESPGADEAPLDHAMRLVRIHRSALLTMALAIATAMAVAGWLQAIERGRLVADLSEQVRAVSASPPPPPRGADPPQLYRTEFRFPAGIAELDPTARRRLAAVTVDLHRRIAALPAGSEWLVGVEGVIERAADGDGLLVAAWELALLRVGVTAQYLVGQGIPAERVSVRFHAGALAPGRRQTQGVALSLFCCLEAPLGG
jgi:hypothetical protein